jgi:hypothetical protein
LHWPEITDAVHWRKTKVIVAKDIKRINVKSKRNKKKYDIKDAESPCVINMPVTSCASHDNIGVYVQQALASDPPGIYVRQARDRPYRGKPTNVTA